MSALPPKADIDRAKVNVRYRAPKYIVFGSQNSFGILSPLKRSGIRNVAPLCSFIHTRFNTVTCVQYG
jgi:hypothetical protein